MYLLSWLTTPKPNTCFLCLDTSPKFTVLYENGFKFPGLAFTESLLLFYEVSLHMWNKHFLLVNLTFFSLIFIPQLLILRGKRKKIFALLYSFRDPDGMPLPWEAVAESRNIWQSRKGKNSYQGTLSDFCLESDHMRALGIYSCLSLHWQEKSLKTSSLNNTLT